jgi:DNA polymerase
MNSGELKELSYQWLMNEKILGEEMIEVVMPKVVESKAIENTRSQRLAEFKKSVMGCKRCGLHKTRKNLVFGEGPPDRSLVFIGEAPGRQEDQRGVPFVGEAGKLLTKLLESVGMDRRDVYITNIVKCRPPGNRDPLPEEKDTCYEWLDGQLEIISPRMICTLGRHATNSLLARSDAGAGVAGASFSQLHGKVYEYKGIRVVPTYHPAALLYHPGWRESVISDLKLLKRLCDEE